MTERGLLIGFHTTLAIGMGVAIARDDLAIFSLCAGLLALVICRIAYKDAKQI